MDYRADFVTLNLGGVIGYKTYRSDGATRILTEKKMLEWLSWLYDDYHFRVMGINALNLESDDEYVLMQLRCIKECCNTHSVDIIYYDSKTAVRRVFSRNKERIWRSRNTSVKKSYVEDYYRVKLKSPKSVIAAAGYYYLLYEELFDAQQRIRMEQFITKIKTLKRK